MRQRSDKLTLKEQGFYHKTAWRRLRLLALQRDNFLCQDCLKKGIIRTAREVHHIIPLEERPDLGLVLKNLRSLCHDCHEATKTRQPKSSRPHPRVRIIKI